MNVTLQQLQKIFPHTTNLELFLLPLNNTLTKYEINNKPRICAFLAQTGHESQEYERIKENLNYNRDSLLRVFPSHFNERNVDQYAHQPIKIANRVYADRMGNGDEASGDGWTYRGKGLIQLTGKWMYQQYANYKGSQLSDIVIYLDAIGGAVDSAGWFWDKEHNLNPLADADNMVGITKIINGGLDGYANRLRLYHLAEDAIVA